MKTRKFESFDRDLPFWIPALIAAGLLFFAGCKRHGGGPQGGGPHSMPAATVTVAPAEQKMLVDWDEFTGRTAPIEFVEVRSRVSGHIQEVRFKSGQMVKKGDVLFLIDPRWAKADVARREADLAQARVRFENAQREAARTKQLLENKAISTEEAEAREARSREAQAAFVAAEAELNT